MRRKILMGVFALALPAGLLAGTTAVASASSPTPNPIMCNHFGATITFSSPYVYTMPGAVQGVATSAKTGGGTTVGGASFNCGGGTNNASFPNINIAGGKNSKLAHSDPRYNKTTGVKYAYGQAASFFSSGAKSLKKSLKTITFTVNGHSTQFKQKGTPTLVTGNAPCPGEVGYVINGEVASPSTTFYYTKTAVLDVCLGTDTGTGVSGNFLGDLLAMKNSTAPASITITGAEIDPANGGATL
jgi:hypothetical protein